MVVGIVAGMVARNGMVSLELRVVGGLGGGECFCGELWWWWLGFREGKGDGENLVVFWSLSWNKWK